MIKKRQRKRQGKMENGKWYGAEQLPDAAKKRFLGLPDLNSQHHTYDRIRVQHTSTAYEYSTGWRLPTNLPDQKSVDPDNLRIVPFRDQPSQRI